MSDVEMRGGAGDSTSSSPSEIDYPSENELIEKLRAGDDKNLRAEYLLLAKQLGYLNLLRECRNAIALAEPQNEGFWCEWIDEEERLSCGDMKFVLHVCQEALADVPSAAIWERFLRLSCKLDSLDDLQKKFYEALTASGNDFFGGIKLWDLYLDAVVAKESKKVALDALKEQMSIPLHGFGENEFEKRLNDLSIGRPSKEYDILIKMFTDNQREVLRRTPFEEQLKNVSGSDMRHAVEQYADFELSCGRKDLAAARLERAVQLDPKVFGLWHRYIFLLAYNPTFERSFVERAFSRALRNFPSNTYLWLEKARYHERLHCPISEVKAIYNSALNNEFASANDYRLIWTEYLWFLRRHANFDQTVDCPIALTFRESFPKAINQLYEYFGEDADPTCSLEKSWAYSEAKYFKDMAQARSIWRENIFEIGNQGCASFWKEYIQFEREFGDEKHVRKAILKAVCSANDDVDEFCEMAVQYELANGTLEQLDEAMRLVNAIRPYSETKAKKPKRKFGEQSKKLTRVPQSETNDQDTTCDMRNLQSKMAKVATTDSNAQPSGNTPIKPNCTVFLSNLSFDCHEATLSRFFAEKVGDIKSLSITKNRKGLSRGYGHVEFNSEDSVQKALLLDHAEIEGRPMFVSPYRPKLNEKTPGGQPEFKYLTSLERTKLFVKNLSKQVDSKDLAEVFGKYGALKDARVVKYRNGHSKGIAYVEFLSESDAAAALLKADGTEIKGSVISVALSNPPERRQPKIQTGRKQMLQTAIREQETNKDQTCSGQLTNADFRKILFKHNE